MNYTDEPVLGKQGILLRALASGPKSTKELIEIMYGMDANGGPDGATETVRCHMWWLKKKLRPGWAIEFMPGRYALVRR